ncbi:hypothetical protein [Flavobacterium sp. LB1P71]|uniref:hypothetical protein n=1 Tax=unclassified Flavobacterium TaxID=196869 RepID=UPI003AAF351C
MNVAEGKKTFIANAISAIITSLTGVFLSIIGLVAYSYIQGGDSYVKSLSKTFLFGGNPSVNTYSICLITSSVIVTMLLMLYWNNRLTTD